MFAPRCTDRLNELRSDARYREVQKGVQLQCEHALARAYDVPDFSDSNGHQAAVRQLTNPDSQVDVILQQIERPGGSGGVHIAGRTQVRTRRQVLHGSNLRNSGLIAPMTYSGHTAAESGPEHSGCMIVSVNSAGVGCAIIGRKFGRRAPWSGAGRDVCGQPSVGRGTDGSIRR